MLIFSDSQNYLELSTHEPTATPYVTGIVEGHIVRCHKSGYIPHPTDEHKYIVCEYNNRWWIHIMGCAPGTRWDQKAEICIIDENI